MHLIKALKYTAMICYNSFGALENKAAKSIKTGPVGTYEEKTNIAVDVNNVPITWRLFIKSSRKYLQIVMFTKQVQFENDPVTENKCSLDN